MGFKGHGCSVLGEAMVGRLRGEGGKRANINT